MKYFWKRTTGLLLTSALVLGLTVYDGIPTGNTNLPEDPGTQQTTQPVAPNSETAGEKLVYSSGGPEEFFKTPRLNPGIYVHNRAVYGHLIVADENLNPIPSHPDALVTYKHNADGKTLTFTLRDGTYWHNEEKVTSEDTKWNIEFVVKASVANAVFILTFSAIAGSKTGNTFDSTFSGIAIDGQKIIIIFGKIAPDALLTFTQFAPVPESEFEGIDPLQVQRAPFFQRPTDYGPFIVKGVNMKSYTILAPFDKCYNGVTGFKIQLLPSAGDSGSNVVTRAKPGNLGHGYTKVVADVRALEGTPGITVIPIDVRYTRLFYPNRFDKKNGSPAPLTNIRVRQALRYTIDMETICRTLFQGSVVPANALAPDANLKGGDLSDYNYNPEETEELLIEADWDPNTIIKAVYYYTDQATVDLMAAAQAYLVDVDIKMGFGLVEDDLAAILWTAPADQTNDPRAVDWDIYYTANAALSLHEYYDRYRTGSPTNSYTPEDTELNRLVDATNAPADVNAQSETFKELIKYGSEDLFTMALYYQPIFLITGDRIGDIQKDTPQFCINWDIQNWNVQ